MWEYISGWPFHTFWNMLNIKPHLCYSEFRNNSRKIRNFRKNKFQRMHARNYHTPSIFVMLWVDWKYWIGLMNHLPNLMLKSLLWGYDLLIFSFLSLTISSVLCGFLSLWPAFFSYYTLFILFKLGGCGKTSFLARYCNGIWLGILLSLPLSPLLYLLIILFFPLLI